MKSKITFFVFSLPLFFSSGIFAQSQGPNSTTFLQNFPCSCPNALGGKWFNEFNATASDNQYANVRVQPYPNCFQASCYWSRHLYAANFGFSIPSNAVVLGIAADVERSASLNSMVIDSAIQLMYNTVPAGINQANMNTWTTTDTYITYGSPSDLWGLTFTPADINSPSFGMYVKLYNTSTTDSVDAFVDHIRMTVYYQTTTGITSQTASPQSFGAYFHPENNEIVISFEAGQYAMPYAAEVYNMQGKLEVRKELGTPAPGSYRLSVDATGLSAGIYFVRLNAGNNHMVHKITVWK